MCCSFLFSSPDGPKQIFCTHDWWWCDWKNDSEHTSQDNWFMSIDVVKFLQEPWGTNCMVLKYPSWMIWIPLKTLPLSYFLNHLEKVPFISFYKLTIHLFLLILTKKYWMRHILVWYVTKDCVYDSIVYIKSWGAKLWIRNFIHPEEYIHLCETCNPLMTI